MTEIVKAEQNALAVSEQPTVMEIIMAMAQDPRVDVAKLQDLLAMQERLEARQAKTAYQKAMKACQEECPVVVRDAQAPNYKYARLESVNQRIRPIIAKHGFSLSFSTGIPRDPKAVRVICRVLHEAGHFEEHELEGDLDTAGAKGGATKTSIQGLGSTVSYLRRYLTLLIFNVVVANEDNDGQKTGFITEQQIAAIQSLLGQCYTDPRESPKVEAGFLSYMKVKAIGEIHAIDFVKATTILESKKRALAKQSTDTPEVDTLPDPIPLAVGSRRRCRGKLYETYESQEGFDWREVRS